MPSIHPTAIVSSEAELADDVSVGAYAILDGPVRIGAGTVVLPHSHVLGRTTVGQRCRIGPAAYVGTPPQHAKADPDAGSLVVGDDVLIRETATLHRSARAGDEDATRVGDRVFVMAAAHVGHDSVVDADAVLAHGVMLGGHCHIGSKAFIGGGAAVHQFCRVGRLAMVRGNEAVTHDVPPFAAALYDGLKGYNAVGCRRAGLSRAAQSGIRAAFAILLSHRLTSQAVACIRREGLDAVAEVAELLAFIATAKRGIQPGLRFSRAQATAAAGDD